MGLFSKIKGGFNAREIKKLDGLADEVESYDDEMQALSDEDLRARTGVFRKRLADGATLDELLPEAYAVAREGARRALGMKPFHVQIIGAIALHQGRIAEMKTGEGKTLVATMAVYLNALEGKGVHVVTVNDYLARRDAEWMGKMYEFLGLTVGCVVHSVEGAARKAAYNCDITYGTNNEFGFDYLRDNMVVEESQLMQRELNYAIIDEVDSILIDEARTPLIISGQGSDSSELYKKADRFVKGLAGTRIAKKDTKVPLAAILPEEEQVDESRYDFIVEEKDRQVSLTDRGIKAAENYFGVENFGDPENMEINHYVMQALKANNIMQRDIDYIVQDNEIIIVDEFTGRLMFGRRFSNGLHQAIEAKEHVTVKAESKTYATITLQNYFRMYGKLAGMTGTAKTEEEEFQDIYNMDVVEVPTNMPMIREDLPDIVYKTEKGKFKALVDRIVEIHEKGQPVLVGTISIEKSELLSDMLRKRGVRHNLLNAKEHAREAEIVADAGRRGQVTIATNMAGRGTDIVLGGNVGFEARREMRKLGYTDEQIAFADSFKQSGDPELNKARDRYNEIRAAIAPERQREHEEVVALGGLYILGSERHESRRIDNQLRGRSGRQGDPGTTQFFISLQDDLMRRFGSERAGSVADRLGLPDDQPLEARILSNSIEGAQKRVEAQNFSTRKYVLQYDNVMNRQREIIYGERRRVLKGEDLREHIMNMRDELVDISVDSATADSRFSEDWDLEALAKSIKAFIPQFTGHKSLSAVRDGELTPDDIKADIKEDLDTIYGEKEREIGPDNMRKVERMVMLRVVDRHWMDHIDAMDQLKAGIGLRSIGQQDPAAAYAKEGLDMFDEMIGAIQEETVRYCYGITINTDATRRQVIRGGVASKSDYSVMGEAEQAEAGGRRRAGRQAAGRDAAAAGPAPERAGRPGTYKRALPKVGRNDPCPCGSGKKYKNCHGRPGMNLNGIGDDLK